MYTHTVYILNENIINRKTVKQSHFNKLITSKTMSPVLSHFSLTPALSAFLTEITVTGLALLSFVKLSTKRGRLYGFTLLP